MSKQRAGVLTENVKATLSTLDALAMETSNLRAESESSENERFNMFQGLKQNEETIKFASDLDECHAMFAECVKSKQPHDQYVCS